MTRIPWSAAALVLILSAVAAAQNLASQAPALRPTLPARDNAPATPTGTGRLGGRVLSTDVAAKIELYRTHAGETRRQG